MFNQNIHHYVIHILTSVEEIKCGLWKAIEDFLLVNPNWKLKERYINNNGLTILEHI